MQNLTPWYVSIVQGGLTSFLLDFGQCFPLSWWMFKSTCYRYVLSFQWGYFYFNLKVAVIYDLTPYDSRYVFSFFIFPPKHKIDKCYMDQRYRIQKEFHKSNISYFQKCCVQYNFKIILIYLYQFQINGYKRLIVSLDMRKIFFSTFCVSRYIWLILG